jgi:ligand-binding sensor domain-containing protein/signal transduction histidine kinase
MHFFDMKASTISLLHCCVLLASSAFLSVAFGQTSFTFDHLDAKGDGLTHNDVTCVLQDRKGFMWFGTIGGLNRYDGYKLIQYRTENRNKTSLPHNSVLCLHEGMDGVLWLGSMGAGLIQYDPKREIFTRYSPTQTIPEALAFSYVRRIVQDNNTLWLGTEKGLVAFDLVNNTFQLHIINNGDALSNDIINLCKGKDGDLFIATGDGAWTYHKSVNMFTRTFPGETSDHPVAVWSIYLDDYGTLWAGFSNGGLIRHNFSTHETKHFLHDPLDASSISSNNVRDIRQIEPGKIWLATDLGINILDLRSEKFERILHNPNNNETISNNSISFLYKDRGNILWACSSGGGINKTDLSRKKFKHYQHDPSNRNSLSNNNVFAITEDYLGKIWIGSIDGGLDQFDPSTEKFVNFSPSIKDPESISSLKILSTGTGPSKNLWIGTDMDGLCMIPAQNLNEKIRFKKYYHGNTSNTINYNVIYSVLEDHTGTLWCGTWSKGLNKLQFPKSAKGGVNYDKPVVTHYEYNLKEKNSISHNVVFNMYEDREGTLWVGTAGGGLNRRKVTRRVIGGKEDVYDTFTSYTTNPDDSTSISDNFVAALYESSTGDFWVGTTTGLNKMDREKGTFTAYTTKDGLASNVVFGILEDAKGNLWLGTHGGISKFDPVKETFRNYSIEDGIQGNVFNPDAYCLSRSGEMYFGGTNGVSVFHPDSIVDNDYKPQVMVTDFRIYKTSGEMLSSNIANEVTLSHEDYIFSFEFAASSYSIPAKNKFAYRMEGFNDQWIYSSADNRTATYTNLDPGSYTFQVRASNADGVWNDEGISIVIHVLPPYWETTWFRTLAVIGVLTIFLLIYFWRIAAIKQQKRVLERVVQERTEEIVAQNEQLVEQQEELEAQRNALALQNQSIEEKNELLENQQLHLEKLVDERTMELLTKNIELQDKNQRFEEYGFMTSHNFRGPVATLLGLCNLFNRKDLADPENLIYMEKIRETTLKIDEMIRDLGFLLDQEKSIDAQFTTVKLEDTISNVKSLLEREIRESHAVIRTDFSEVAQVRGVPAYLTSIFYNLVSNAIKFRKEEVTPEIEIRSFHDDGKFIFISFKDNGRGIDLDQHANTIFHPFKRFHTEIPGKGLGLYLVKTQLKAMAGHIQIESKKGKGTTFRLVLKKPE